MSASELRWTIEKVLGKKADDTVFKDAEAMSLAVVDFLSKHEKFAVVNSKTTLLSFASMLSATIKSLKKEDDRRKALAAMIALLVEAIDPLEGDIPPDNKSSAILCNMMRACGFLFDDGTRVSAVCAVMAALICAGAHDDKELREQRIGAATEAITNMARLMIDGAAAEKKNQEPQATKH